MWDGGGGVGVRARFSLSNQAGGLDHATIFAGAPVRDRGFVGVQLDDGVIDAVARKGGEHMLYRMNLDVALGQSGGRSEEHTSELQSQSNLVCRLLLEKKKKLAETCIRTA